jgi:hypothetical protein
MPRSVRFHEFGGPDVLKIEDVVVPDPGFQEVRLRVKAIGLNRSEVLTRSGRSATKPRVDILFGVAVGPVPVGRLTVSKSNSRRTSSMSDFRPTISSPCCGSGSSMPASASITCCRSAAGRKIQARRARFGRETLSSRYLRQEANNGQVCYCGDH